MGWKGDDGVLTLRQEEFYQLSNANDVAAYLEEASHGSDEEDIDLIALAFYPGFFKEDDSDECRALPIAALCEWMPMQTIAQGLKRYASARSKIGRHTLYHLPKAYVAKLGAYASLRENPFSKLPDARLFHASLIEGWKYQLANPDEPYPELVLRTARNIGDGTAATVIAELFAATGLTEADFLRVENAVIALAGDSQAGIRNTTLRLLAEMTATRTGKNQIIGVDLEALGPIVAEGPWSF